MHLQILKMINYRRKHSSTALYIKHNFNTSNWVADTLKASYSCALRIASRGCPILFWGMTLHPSEVMWTGRKGACAEVYNRVTAVPRHHSYWTCSGRTTGSWSEAGHVTLITCCSGPNVKARRSLTPFESHALCASTKSPVGTSTHC